MSPKRIENAAFQRGKQAAGHPSHRNHLEDNHADIGQRKQPAGHKRGLQAVRLIGIGYLSSGDREHGGHFGIGEADEDHHQPSGQEGDDSSQTAGLGQPLTQNRDPPDPDDGPEGK